MRRWPAMILGAALLVASSLAAAATDTLAEDALLAQITRRAYDAPEAMLAELQQRWPAGPTRPKPLPNS